MSYRWHLLLVLGASVIMASCDHTPKLKLGEERIQPGEEQIADQITKLIKEISIARSRTRSGEVRRFNQVKSLGCIDAKLTVYDQLPDSMSHGLFAKAGTYPAILRFANATQDDDREKDLRGLSIKISGLDAVSGNDPDQVQDFLMNSHPALFAADPEDFLSFIEATSEDRIWQYFANPLNSHLKSLWVLLKARGNPTSPFDIRYWSTTPFRLGTDTSSAVKYSVQSCSNFTTDETAERGSDYLSKAMASHLDRGPACFEFMVQFQSDPETMPIEDASVIWSETISPFEPVAEIVVEKQEFLDAASMTACERLSFNPWNSLIEHQPIGGINRVRKSIYTAVSNFRLSGNSTD